jgi:hypothetical protein
VFGSKFFHQDFLFRFVFGWRNCAGVCEFL